MSRKVIVTFKKISDGTKRRLLIVDGVVINTQVDTEITSNMEDFYSVQLRRSGEPVRNLAITSNEE